MDIQESGENYLETILFIQEAKGTVRSVDIVEDLKLAKSSVSRAISILKKRGFIEVGDSGAILLTPAGYEKAAALKERHKILTQCLILIGVSEAVAEADACKIEHYLSEETFEKIKNYFKKCS